MPTVCDPNATDACTPSCAPPVPVPFSCTDVDAPSASATCSSAERAPGADGRNVAANEHDALRASGPVHVLLPMAKSTQLLLVIDIADASAVPLLVTVTVVAALAASTAVAGKLTGDGDALNAGTRAGIVVTDQFERSWRSCT